MSFTTPPATEIAYPWQRFWYGRTDVMDLSDGGFLSDPTSRIWLASHKMPSTLDELSTLRAIVLLGEPGIGKSTALAEESARVAAQSAGENVASMRVDLRDFSSESLLHKKIFENPQFLAWSKDSTQLVLHLDSLDEALLRIDTIANLLASELPQFPVARMAVRIACRTAVWPAATLEPALQKIWGEAAFGAFELAPLRRRDVRAAAELRGIDPERFIMALFEADAVLFAIKPLTLKLLFRIFENDGKLPRGVAELYRLGCGVLCEETNPSRRDSRRMGSLSVPQRYRLAGRAAAVTMLANRYAIWMGAASQGVPSEDVTLSGLATGCIETSTPTVMVTEDHYREVLDTGLFSSRGPNRMGWAHQGYAEFMAADYLVQKKISVANLLKILMHPSGGLVPQLAVMAAWVASLSKDVRNHLIRSEPLVLLRGDLSGWSDKDKAELTQSFLTALEESRVNDLMMGIFSFYSRLDHPGLGAQLRPYVRDATRKTMSRRAAIMIAEACALKELQPEFLALAFDETVETSLRARAVSALRTCGDATVPALMKPLARIDKKHDPEDEIRGYALQILWPRHLKASDLFAMLIHPNEGFAGSYVHFLNYILPDTLSVADFSLALGWAQSFVAKASHNGDFHRKSLADSIFVRAWRHMDNPTILRDLLDYVQTCLSQAGELFRGTHGREADAFVDDIKSDSLSRHRFLRALAVRAVSRFDVFNYRRAGLLQPVDLPWLLGLAPGGDAYDAALNEETLCHLVEDAGNPYEPDQFELLYAAALHWPMLWRHWRGIFEGVMFGSAEAQQLKQQYDAIQGFRQNKPALLYPPPAERVATMLARVEAGGWRLFWRLALELTLDSNATGYWSESSYSITGLPGWKNASGDTRTRILKAAELFLTIGKTYVHQWIGSGRFFRSDAAAYRALILLKEQDPIAYDRISTQTWQKWAPAIAGLPQDMGDKPPVAQALVRHDGLLNAPNGFTLAIRTLIRRERWRVANNAPSTLPGASFLFLRDFRDCTDSAKFCAVLFEELRNPNNSVDQFAVLADAILAGKYASARDWLLDQLTSEALKGQSRYVAVTALVSHALREAWPTIWPMISSDRTFFREFFIMLAQRYPFRENIFEGLTEMELGELYVLMEQVFRRQDDPKHHAGVAHGMEPADHVAHLRDSLPGLIVARGTMDAVNAMRYTVVQLPKLDWLTFLLREAEQLMRMRTWAPLLPTELHRLLDLQSSELVQSADDLCQILINCLMGYEKYLHGEQTPVQSLWDRQGGGRMFRPKEEDALSDHVKLYLQRELADKGIIANREVEVGRIPGAPIGKRADIRIDAIRRNVDNTPIDTLTAVIETKGCWNPGLFRSLRTQLFGDYMVRLAAPVGIYLIGWFDKAKWDVKDPRRSATPEITRKQAQSRLNRQAAKIPKGFKIRAVVLDCRMH